MQIMAEKPAQSAASPQQSKPLDHVAALTQMRDRDRLDDGLASALDELIDAQSVAVYRILGEAADRRWLPRARVCRGKPDLTLDAAWLEPDSLSSLREHPLRHAALAGQIVADAGPDHCVTVFPLLTDAGAVGVVEVLSKTPLDAAARNLVSAILRINGNFQSLLDYCERDTLTGLLNRKTFDESFFKALQGRPAPVERRWANANAAKTSWLAMIDIDNFKAVNDTYGHLIGDEVLLLLARLMRRTLRGSDRVYRFGGEEFVAVLPCEHESDIANVLERLRRDTEAYAFPQVGRLTISIGFTPILPSDSPSSALERADRALYFAKANGRNQVCSHGDLVANGRLSTSDNVGGIELF
jgi:diguanylate cyclase (GGDEF)-like protein